MQKPTRGPAHACAWLVACCKPARTAWWGRREAPSLPGCAAGCSEAGDEWGVVVLLVVTKSFRPGEIWSELWVNCAYMSEIALEGRNFPLGKD